MMTFIIGGARSGKSRFALKNASSNSGEKAYIATAEALDDEMRGRIEKHKRERSDEWITFEEPLKIASLINDFSSKYDVILIDCLTLWLSNLLLSNKQIVEEIDCLVSNLNTCKSSLYIVSNEVGQGIVPDNEIARLFREFSGLLNQKVSEISDEVYLMTAGIPLKIK